MQICRRVRFPLFIFNNKNDGKKSAVVAAGLAERMATAILIIITDLNIQVVEGTGNNNQKKLEKETKINK